LISFAQQAEVSEDASNLPVNNEHSLLSYCLEIEEYEVVIELTANLAKTVLVPQIKSGKSALELMKLDPSLAKIFVQDQRIVDMLRELSSCIVTNKTIDWYKVAGRRNSWFAQFNIDAETVSLYTYYKLVGEGSNGLVRLFKNEQNEVLAVKSLKSELIINSPELLAKLNSLLEIEAQFNDELYPGTEPTRIFEYCCPGDNSNDTFYTNRLIRPYFPGEHSLEFVKSIKNNIDFAQFILKMVEELNRINMHGIIHGDLNPQNIIVTRALDSFRIRYIDYSCSYRLSDASAYMWTDPAIIQPDGKPLDRAWFPPEQWGIGKQPIKPHLSQNVYSLGHTLTTLIGQYPLMREFLADFSSILIFLEIAQCNDPSQRPTLSEFYIELKAEIELVINNARNDLVDIWDLSDLNDLSPDSPLSPLAPFKRKDFADQSSGVSNQVDEIAVVDSKDGASVDDNKQNNPRLPMAPAIEKHGIWKKSLEKKDKEENKKHCLLI
jgi:serine/threonine protein kinase